VLVTNGRLLVNGTGGVVRPVCLALGLKPTAKAAGEGGVGDGERGLVERFPAEEDMALLIAAKLKGMVVDYCIYWQFRL